MKIEIKWAGIFAGMTLVWMYLEKAVGLHDVHIDKHATYTNFYAIPAIAVYVFALLEKRKTDFGGFMTYQQGFMTGLFMTLAITVLSPITQYITSTFITPDYFSNVIAHVEKAGLMTREAAEATFNLKSYLLQSVIGACVMGLFTTAIVAIFTRKAAPVESGTT